MPRGVSAMPPNGTGAALREGLRDALAAYEPGRHGDGAGKPAAVLLLLYERDDGVHCLFQQRSQRVEHHKGQIGFPGGARDAGDASAAFTALRETHEEVGVAPADVDLLGELDEIRTISGFRVRPFVGWLRDWPYPFRRDPREVAALLEAPLAHLADPANLADDVREVDGRHVVLPSYRWGEHLIWGATARILANFLDVRRTLDR